MMADAPKLSDEAKIMLLVEALERVQWAGRDRFRCVDCGGQPVTGHTESCAVARALAATRPEGAG